MIIGGVVCTALHGRRLRHRPQDRLLDRGDARPAGEVEISVGAAVSAATVAGVMMLLNKTYGFGPDSQLVATAGECHGGGHQTVDGWRRHAVDALFRRCGIRADTTMIGVPALAFALGMFILLDLNTPLLIGGRPVGSFRHAARMLRSTKPGDRGTLIASGLIAGGALMDVVSAILKYLNVDSDAYLVVRYDRFRSGSHPRLCRADCLCRMGFQAGQAGSFGINT